MSWKISFIILLIIVVGGLGILGVKGVKPYLDNLDVIQFSISHPKMVKAIQTQYASDSARLEMSFEQQSPTPQDQLINAVTQGLSKP